MATQQITTFDNQSALMVGAAAASHHRDPSGSFHKVLTIGTDFKSNLGYVGPESPMILLQTTEDVVTDATSTANIVTLSGATETELTAPPTTNEIDFINKLPQKIWDNSLVWCGFFMGELIAIQTNAATAIEGLQVGALLEGDTTNVIDNLTPYDGVFDASSLTANNTFSHASDDNGIAFVRWNNTDSVWDMIQCACPS